MSLLKEQTQSLHEQAEQSFDLPRRVASRSEYERLLARFYGYYAPLEARLLKMEGYETAGIDLASRRKAPKLREDLKSLGWSEAQIDAAPPCEQVPEVHALPQALGCLYVTEGATLGGQIIRKQVEGQLGLDAEHGCSFFSGYGSHTGEAWREFADRMNRYAAQHPQCEPQIVAKAQETFRSLGEWIAC